MEYFRDVHFDNLDIFMFAFKPKVHIWLKLNQ